VLKAASHPVGDLVLLLEARGADMNARTDKGQTVTDLLGIELSELKDISNNR
jgi:hypothetical protein